jgi:hypothetical protein
MLDQMYSHCQRYSLISCTGTISRWSRHRPPQEGLDLSRPSSPRSRASVLQTPITRIIRNEENESIDISQPETERKPFLGATSKFKGDITCSGISSRPKRNHASENLDGEILSFWVVEKTKAKLGKMYKLHTGPVMTFVSSQPRGRELNRTSQIHGGPFSLCVAQFVEHYFWEHCDGLR